MIIIKHGVQYWKVTIGNFSDVETGFIGTLQFALWHILRQHGLKQAAIVPVSKLHVQCRNFLLVLRNGLAV